METTPIISPTPNHPTPAGGKGFLGSLTERLDNIQTWYGTGGILWAVFGAAAKNSDWLGTMSWGEALIAGALLTVVVMIGLTTCWSLYHSFNPHSALKAEKKQLIGSARGTVLGYYSNHEGLNFRQYAERTAAYPMLRHHFSQSFLVKMNNCKSIRIDLAESDEFAEAYRDEINRIARKWGVL